MKNKFKLLLGLLLSILMTACSTSNDVVGNRSIQKRKYNDGYYISFNKKNNKRVKDNKEPEVQPSEDETAEIILEESKVNETPSGSVTKNYIEHIEIDEAGGYAEDDQIFAEDEKPKKDALKRGITKARELVYPKVSNKINRDQPENSGIEKKIENNAAAGNSDVMLILLVILAIILPPLAVFIFEGATTRFWITLILWLLGWGVGWYLWGSRGGLFSLIAVIYALLIVLGVI